MFFSLDFFHLTLFALSFLNLLEFGGERIPRPRRVRLGRRTIITNKIGVRSKKFEQISPKICRAGGIPPKPPFRPPAEVTLSDWTISSFSLAANKFEVRGAHTTALS